MNKEMAEQIKSCAILTLSIIILTNLLLATGKKKEDSKDSNYKIYYETSNNLKAKYTKDEFNNLLKNKNAKIIYDKYYYINTHMQENANYIAPDGYELWQEYLLVNVDSSNIEYIATDNYLLVKAKPQKMLRTL